MPAQGHRHGEMETHLQGTAARSKEPEDVCIIEIIAAEANNWSDDSDPSNV